mmetsp:Transcript_385/g.1136  ORF Transcript_385/g.1136 Transcript_385/m.1136 type:complete len:996 (+) Transcript_385:518-3505(+)
MDNAGSHTEHLLQSHVRNSSHSFSFPVVGARQNGSNAPLNESAPHRLQQSNLPKAASPHADGIGGPSSAPQSVRAESTISQLSVGDGTSRSVRKSMADVKREGWLYRESTILDGVVNPRYSAVYAQALVTFRDPQSDTPTKVWPLHAQCQLSPIEQGDFSVRKRNSNLVVAFATRHVHRKRMYYFSLRWPQNHIFFGEPLKLCFADAADAEAWRDTLVSAITVLGTGGGPQPSQRLTKHQKSGSLGRLRRQFTPGRSKSREHSRRLSDKSQGHGSWGSRSLPPGVDEGSRFSFRRDLNTSGTSQQLPEQQGLAEPLVPPSAHSAPGAVSAAADAALAEPRDDDCRRKWCSFRHVCGVAIYQEPEEERGEEGGATMVSTCVRSAPSVVFKSLMDVESARGLFPFFAAAKLEDKSAHTRVVHGWMHPSGWPGIFCAPRDAVVEQHWRQEEDGTFVVFMHSVKHHAARPPPRRWFSWYRPIRAQIVACTYSVAPLQPKNAGGPPECLVTMLLKARLGGWLGDGLPQRPTRLCQVLRPLLNALHGAYLDPLLLSVITLRDSVEQDRFVVQPFTMRSTDGAEGALLPHPDRRGSEGLHAQHSGHLLAPAVTAPSMDFARQSLALGGGSTAEGMGSTQGTPRGQIAGGPPAPPQCPTTGQGTEPTLDRSMWSYPGACDFKLRGKKYLRDRKKVPAIDPVFALSACDLTESDELVWNVGRYLPSIKNSEAPFTFVVNFMVPGPPFRNLVMSWASKSVPPGWTHAFASASGEPTESSSPPLTPTHRAVSAEDLSPASRRRTSRTESQADDSSSGSRFEDSTWHSEEAHSVVGDLDDTESDAESPFDVSLARFLGGNGHEAARRRNARFKLIPHIIKSSWVVKQAVGTTPVLLGNKLVTKYFKGERYFEVDVDISSSYAASGVVNIVKGATKSMVIDFAVLIEGQAEDELPERLLGTCRFSHLDMDSGLFLDHEGKLHPRDAPESRQMRAASRARSASGKHKAA